MLMLVMVMVGDGDGVSVCVVESVGDCQRHAADWRR